MFLFLSGRSNACYCVKNGQDFLPRNQRPCRVWRLSTVWIVCFAKTMCSFSNRSVFDIFSSPHNFTSCYKNNFFQMIPVTGWATTGSPHKRRVWLFVWNIKKCMEWYWRVLYRKLISRNGPVKAQNKCKPTSIVVCCRFCGSTWRIWAILWVLRWLLLYVIRRTV